MDDFGVIGLGSVGWAVVHGLHSHGYSYVGYDIADDYDWSALLKTRILFMCTSTPMSIDGRLDATSVDANLERLDDENYDGLIVVKSTIPIGFMDKESKTHPKLRLVYMPEFIRERNSFGWFLYPDRIVAAGNIDDVQCALQYFKWVKDAELIITDFISAEIGKLSHNSYIATKVSFTNEMENICKKFNGNPNDVMQIIWTDRRVRCKEHLTPGLGPYAGKCVPKDVNELMRCTSSNFLKAVQEVNDRCPVPASKTIYPDVHVIVPTNDRPSYLKKALESVCHQTYLPRSIKVVAEQNVELERQVIEIMSDCQHPPIDCIVNSHKEGVSGAINAGLQDISGSSSGIGNSFIALLDDDDWWDRRYLENCIKYAYETEADWVISGIIRHDDNHPNVRFQDIPTNLSVDDFLVGNPNVQNSNLFIRASSLQAVGGYDESLASTTDRDVCIRLLQSNTKYAVLFNHLVHHEASSRKDRLSCPGSPKKRKGLEAFFKKYGGQMTEDQRMAFKDRAKKMFNIEIDEGRF